MDDSAIATIIVGLLVAVPATIGAWSSRGTRRDLSTNNGRKPGDYIETTAAAVLDHGLILAGHDRKLDALNASLTDHMAVDEANFQGLRDMLTRQDELAAQVSATLERTEDTALEESVQEHHRADDEHFAEVQEALARQDELAAERAKDGP